MNYQHMLSENFRDLDKIALKEKTNYINAKPFPNITFKNFFNNTFLNEILKEFPDLSKMSFCAESQHFPNCSAHVVKSGLLVRVVSYFTA